MTSRRLTSVVASSILVLTGFLVFSSSANAENLSTNEATDIQFYKFNNYPNSAGTIGFKQYAGKNVDLPPGRYDISGLLEKVHITRGWCVREYSRGQYYYYDGNVGSGDRYVNVVRSGGDNDFGLYARPAGGCRVGH